jgi:branched-chain amino acid transport system substrate-binding protein
VSATKAQDSIFVVSNTATKNFTFLAGQEPLSITNGTLTHSTGTVVTLTSSGGSGTGATTYALSTPNALCSLVGATVTASQPTQCSVVATKAAQGLYASKTSAAVIFIFKGPQATLTVSNTTRTNAVGTSVTLTTAGGSGSGAVTYALQSPAANCTLTDGVLGASAAASCVVTATKASDGTYAQAVSAPVTFNFLGAQAAFSISNSTLTNSVGTSVTITTAGGSGSGAITYALSTPNAQCSLRRNILTARAGTTCSVVATKAASGIYASITSDPVVFTFQVLQRTFSIAYQGPLSGPEAAIGISQLNAARYAASVFMANHPNITVNLVEIDDQGDPAVAAIVSQTAAQNSDLIGLIGPAYSGATFVSCPFYRASGIPMISPSATNPGLTDSTSSYYCGDVFHRMSSYGVKEGIAIARLAIKDVSAPRVFVISDSGDGFSVSLANHTINALNSVPNSVLVGYQAHQNTSDYTPLIAAINNAQPNIIVYTGYGWNASILLKQLRDAAVNSVFVGSSSLYFDPNFEVRNNAGSGVRIVGLPSLSEVNPAMAIDYRRVIGSDAGIYSVETIDATNVLLNGLNSGVVTRSQLLSYINAYSGRGLRGLNLSFSSLGDLNGNSFVGYEWINGQFRQTILNF